MLTLLGVLFTLVVVARLRLVKLEEGTLGRFGEDLPPLAAPSSRLQVAVHGPGASYPPAVPKSGF
jgi:hypothetical protein